MGEGRGARRGRGEGGEEEGRGRRKRGRVGRRRGGGGEGGEGRGREDAAEWPGLRWPLPVGRSSGRTLKALASFWTPGTPSAWLRNLGEPFAYEGCVRGRTAPKEGTPKEDKDRFKPTEQTHVPEAINHRHCLSISWCLPCAVLGARRHPEAGTPTPTPRPQGPANSSRVKAPGPCPLRVLAPACPWPAGSS